LGEGAREGGGTRRETQYKEKENSFCVVPNKLLLGRRERKKGVPQGSRGGGKKRPRKKKKIRKELLFIARERKPLQGEGGLASLKGKKGEGWS